MTTAETTRLWADIWEAANSVVEHLGTLQLAAAERDLLAQERLSNGQKVGLEVIQAELAGRRATANRGRIV